jgi:hypothetical protein
MQPLKAHVRNGRLVLDEPTDLPEGSEVDAMLADDALEPGERARLIEAVEAGVENFERGDHVDGFAFVAKLRSQP